MWIFLSIVGVIALIILAILMLPVYIIIKSDENGELILRYKILFKTFGENPDPDDPLVKTLKKAGGVERLEKDSVEKNIRTDGLQKTISDSYAALVGLLKELVFLLKNCTVTRLDIKIRSADDDPSQAAICYGIYNAATHTLLGALRSFLRVRKRGCNIDIRCDFQQRTPLFRYHLVLAVPLYRVLQAFLHVVVAEAKRKKQAS
jgi:hypothetical protein